jgi:hypothetical protein
MTFSVDDAGTNAQRASAPARVATVNTPPIMLAAFGFSLDSATFLRLVAAAYH